MRKNNRIFVASLVALFMMSAVACGSDADVVTPVAEENVVVLENTQEPIKEVESNATYVEANGLVFEKDTKAETKGTLYSGEDIDNFDIIDVGWEVTNITISDAENGVQTVIIEQEIRGFIWTDGSIYKTNLNVPTGRLYDIYSGKKIFVSEEAKETEVIWKDNTYSIHATETVSWEDGDWSVDWVEDPGGGERLSSILKVRSVIEVTEGYDGLALVLVPLKDANGSIDGGCIMDVWGDGSYLFNVNELSHKFENAVETGTVASVEDGGEEVTAITNPAVTTASTEQPVNEAQKPSSSTPKPTEEPVETTTIPVEETKPVHSHNHTGVVTVQPSCTVAGVKTYTCSCGDSYTEDLGKTAHDYSVLITQTVHHEDQYEAVRREIPEKKVIVCGCGAEFTDYDEWQAHAVSNIEANGPFCACGSNYLVNSYPASYTYDYVLITPAYDSEEIVGYTCSVCGQQK